MKYWSYTRSVVIQMWSYDITIEYRKHIRIATTLWGNLGVY